MNQSTKIPIENMKLDPQIAQKLELTVIDILKFSDIDSITEKHVRNIAAQRLNLDLDDLPFKIFIRQIVEAFLLDQNDHVLLTDNHNHTGDNVNNGGINVNNGGNNPTNHVVVSNGSCRVICKLSQKRDVAVKSSGGQSEVSIREVMWKDGRSLPTNKGISLSSDQWSIFRKSIPAIEEAITKVESRLRSKVVKKEADDDLAENVSKQNGVLQTRAEPVQKVSTHHKPNPTPTRKQVGDASTLPSTPHRLVPIEIIRFDGKNYQRWADLMESYLKHLKIAYVLSDPCPNAVGVTIGELTQTLSAVQKWVEDDHVCRQNILNSLCDSLFDHYSKKRGSAKDLWEELRLVYLFEEHGAKVTLVKKYLEFQIIEEKSVFEQVQELHHIADSLVASGMYVEEKFHVNVIISKLPPSWKPYSIDLMKEDYLPVWMLMNHLKAEDEARGKVIRNEAPPPKPNDFPPFQPVKKLGPQRYPMKKTGIPLVNHEVDRERKLKFCNICKKKGHLPEQCWFRDSNSNEDNVMSANGVAEGGADGAASQSKP